MTFLVRGDPVSPASPGTPTLASSAVTGGSAVLTAAGDAPAGWLDWEFETGPSSGGPWTQVSAGYQTSNVFTLTGLSPNVTYYARVRGRTNILQVSAYSTAISFSTSTKYWNPGNYVRPDHRGTPVKDADHEGAIAAVLAHPNTANVKGILVPVPWARIENAEDVFTWGWLDTRINLITANGTNGKRVILNLEMYSYGSSTEPSTPQNANDAIIPDYIIDAGWCGDGNGIMPKIDVADCRDRVINVMAQLVDRYGNHPNVEMIGLGETSRDYVGINSTNYNNNWLDIADALVTQTASKLAWGFIDHNGMLANDYAKVIQMADIMDQGDIASSTADVIGFFSNTAAPPGVDISLRGNAALLARMNYGYSPDKAYTFTNGDATDRRLWVPCKAEHQVVRPSALTNDIVRWYLDNWEKASHPVWTLRIGAGGVSYGANLYGSSTPAPSDFNGTNTLNYVALAGNAPARTAYPSP